MQNEQDPTQDKTPAGVVAKRVLLVVVLAYLVALVAMNTDEVGVNFVFFEMRTPLVVALVLAGVLGAVLGWLVAAMRRRHKKG